MGTSACSSCRRGDRRQPDESLGILESVAAAQARRGGGPSPEERLMAREQELRQQAAAAIARARGEAGDGGAFELAHGPSGAAAFPEAVAMGGRISVAVMGLERGNPERLNTPKGRAIMGVSNLEQLADEHGCYIACQSGTTPWDPRPNQDDFFFAVTQDGFQLCGVLDGHGDDGHRVAAAARLAFLEALAEQLPSHGEAEAPGFDRRVCKAIDRAFGGVQQRLAHWDSDDMDVDFSGAAATILVYSLKRRVLYAAWSGNVRCVVGEVLESTEELDHDKLTRAPDATPKRKKNKTVTASPLTQDHTTRARGERARVEAAGQAKIQPGTYSTVDIVAVGEEWPGIPLTRCLGNNIAQQVGVSWKPELVTRSLMKGAEAKFAVLASDGLWDTLGQGEVVNFIYSAKRENMQFGVNNVVAKAQEFWPKRPEQSGYVDDITVLVLWF